MNEQVQRLTSLLQDMWPRRWFGVAVAWGVAVIGAGLVLSMSEKYEATARVYVDTQSVLKPLMSGLTVQPDIDQQVGMLARTLITRPNVESLVRNLHIDPPQTGPAAFDQFVDRLVRNIKVARGGRENLFTISYRDVDPARSERIVAGLVSFFVESGLGDKRRDSEDARKFIDEQIATYERKLEEAENRLKEFKLRNFGFTANSLGQDYFARMAAASDDLAKLRGDLRAAEQSRDALRMQLSGEAPIVATPNSTMPQRLSEVDTRLEAQHKQLDELLRRYTDDHPDVVNVRRVIHDLEAEKRAEADRSKMSPSLVTSANNPVFQQIKVQLSQEEAAVASLRSRVSDVQARYDQLRSIAGRAPQIEAEMAQLNRDYEVLRRNYEQLVARRESASISGSVDASSKLTEFRVIEPPRVSPRPVFPQHAALIPLVLVASLAAGIAASLGLARAFPTVQTARQLRELVQPRVILGLLTMQIGESDIRASRVANMKFASAIGALIVVYSTWLGWVVIHARA